MKVYTTYTKSPIGWILLQSSGEKICRANAISQPGDERQESESPVLQKAITQLSEYFAGQRKAFDLPLIQQGTSFQQKVWNELLKIPYGETISYAELAIRTGHTKACRAVGAANGKNQLFILVPCHRVIQSGGRLGGFANGVAMKQFLLDLEQQTRSM